MSTISIQKSKLNQALTTACSMGELRTVMTLMDLGAQPDCMALSAAVLGDQFAVVNALLIFPPHAFDDHRAVPTLQFALEIAGRYKKPRHADIIDSINDQIAFAAKKHKPVVSTSNIFWEILKKLKSYIYLVFKARTR